MFQDEVFIWTSNDIMVFWGDIFTQTNNGILVFWHKKLLYGQGPV